MFTSEEFSNHVFKSKDPIILDEEFLKEVINESIIWGTFSTPLEWAVNKGNLGIVKFLVENGADITLHKNFPINAAIRRDRADMVKCLLSTNIYTEKVIHSCVHSFTYDSKIKKLLVNYRQFSYTKACR